jgi:predicted CopG family antitoxin
MAHKTLTISEDAYAELARLKARGESFTEVILRLTTKTRIGTLLDYVRTMKPDEELARTLEEIVKRRERTQFRPVKDSERFEANSRTQGHQ